MKKSSFIIFFLFASVLLFTVFIKAPIAAELEVRELMDNNKGVKITVQIEGQGTLEMLNNNNSSSYSANGGRITSIFKAGTEVKLTAIPAEGWKFKSWEGDLENTENEVSITVEEDLNIKAVFVKTI